jgi:CheY-like chemotaxis protein
MIKTALVVDDSKSARFALRKFLEGFNYKVNTADGAADAYRQLAGPLPDVVFLDHIMPGVDGFEALKVIRADPLTAKLPVVICSSNEGEDFVHQAKLRGATDVLQKPPSPEQIAGVLANLSNQETDFAALAPKLQPEPAPVREGPSMMERLMAAIPAKSGTVSAAPAPITPSKVQPIREPAVAIQQAVMKSLRDAMPQNSEPRPQALPELPAVPTLSSESPALAAASLEQLREESEERFAQLRQDLFAEMQALRQQLSQLNVGSGGSEERLRNLAQEAAKSRTNALAQTLEQHLTSLQANLDAVLRAQNERLEQALQLVRQTAAEEAERVVMNAAQRIADQMTSSMLKTMGQQLSSLGRGSF